MSQTIRSLSLSLLLVGLVGYGAEPAAAPGADRRPGYIQVKCEPGVRLLIDGKAAGMSSKELGGLVIQDVLPGQYVIQAQKEGFRAQEFRVRLEPAAVQVVRVLPFQERVPAGGAPAPALGEYTGTLIVKTVPVDCRLRIPNLGIDADTFAPESRCEGVPPGTYDIEGVALGQTLKQAVVIEPGKTAEVLLNFLRGEVQTVAAPPTAGPGEVTAAPALSTAEAMKRTEAVLAETERQLADVRSVLQVARQGIGLDEVKRLMARRDELARRQRDLAFEVSVMRQRSRNEEESARREAALQRRKQFEAEYAEYGQLVRDPDLLPEVKDQAWQALCKSWSVDPGKGAGRLLWDDNRAAPYRILSRIVDLGEGVELELVEIIAGAFTMGSEEGDDDEKPVRSITMNKPFWIGKYEVTQSQYRAVSGTVPAHFRGEDRPVEGVTWQDACAFCARLSERERKAERLPAGYQYRLPTEAEWEYACRAGSSSPFAFGDRLDPALANYDVSQGAGRGGPSPARETLPVGSFRPNAWDLYDMHGNVWEWCLDYYDREYYARAPLITPYNVRPSSAVVCRGGSWTNPMSFCRSANRNYGDPRQANHMTGFRVVLGPRLVE